VTNITKNYAGRTDTSAGHMRPADRWLITSAIKHSVRLADA